MGATVDDWSRDRERLGGRLESDVLRILTPMSNSLGKVSTANAGKKSVRA